MGNVAETATVERRVHGVGDAAVRARTGKGWDAWLAVLDADGARDLGHREIVELVGRHLPAEDGWWQQLVTVAYEQARGLRAKHQKPDGFQISRSKTVAVPIARLYAAFTDPAAQAAWLGQEAVAAITPRTCHLDKSARLLWTDGRTTVDALFYEKGADKSQVALQHSKLADADEAAAMKAYWGERLDALKALLER
jgi:hypothetical protein